MRSPASTACRSCPTRRSPARLYASVEVDQAIPEEFFHAVAQVLAFVYRSRGQEVAA